MKAQLIPAKKNCFYSKKIRNATPFLSDSTRKMKGENGWTPLTKEEQGPRKGALLKIRNRIEKKTENREEGRRNGVCAAVMT